MTTQNMRCESAEYNGDCDIVGLGIIAKNAEFYSQVIPLCLLNQPTKHTRKVSLPLWKNSTPGMLKKSILAMEIP